MNVSTIRALLAVAAVYMVIKTASAPRRGTFFTLFGNIRREAKPRAFIACLAAGYALAGVALLAALFPDAWVPTLASLQAT